MQGVDSKADYPAESSGVARHPLSIIDLAVDPYHQPSHWFIAISSHYEIAQASCQARRGQKDLLAADSQRSRKASKGVGQMERESCGTYAKVDGARVSASELLGRTAASDTGRPLAPSEENGAPRFCIHSDFGTYRHSCNKPTSAAAI